ncbi:haloacid dehalogenase-like hydrolase [Parafrankia sp. EUN1f]|uniref:HAD family hydrolase n=1 Tax=Parafrankia sp. EUN1f TaxID=102897 RepID=UPI0001C45B5A|nr:haloacid dehalogenase-like hydrolase [Parafrankia sp. EUN1f]EFC81667.1 Haloacid dehalogenase domain protein hydrolase [Parafrankia sp. EUN1f]
MPEPALVLWDIDATLLTIRPLGREIHAAAFAETIGRPLRERAVTTGRTEQAIVLDTLRANDAPTDADTISALFEAMGRAAVTIEDRMREFGRQMPGAAAAIASLAVAGVVQSVVTGNLRSVTGSKLRALGLTDHLDLSVGGYGDDGLDRADLVRRAIERTQAAYGRAFAPARVIVIGDTPHDVRGALDVGVRAVAVASGETTAEDLAAAGADAVLADLTDLDALWRAMFGGAQTRGLPV